jgi:ribosome-associated protein
MIKINDHISIDPSELNFKFVQSGGPGGQHVNKVATTVQLRFNVLHSSSIPDRYKSLLLKNLSSRLTADGELVITAREFRSQHRNKEAAIRRLVDILKQAVTIPKKRRKTKPSFGAIQKRLKKKKLRSQTKKNRRSVRHTDE